MDGALGFGARQAVKTLTTAVDAATAPNPAPRSASRASQAECRLKHRSRLNAPNRDGNSKSGCDSRTISNVPGTPAKKAAQTAARTAVQAREVKQGLGRGTRRFGEAVWRPFVRLSGVVWLEVTGVFFGIFALVALGYLWKLRGAWHANAANAGAHRSLMGALIMLALFGYFCVSSFVRARKREQRAVSARQSQDAPTDGRWERPATTQWGRACQRLPGDSVAPLVMHRGT